MTLLSYADNGADIVLHRALSDVEAGHYVDIGASEPVERSTTKLFYDRGWSGVNVEPSRAFFDKLSGERGRDRNFNLAVAPRAGIVRIEVFEGAGLSTTDPDVATAARDRGLASRSFEAPALTLADICLDLPFETVHFLKVDVGGREVDVLQGGDFERFRPWIVMVKAVEPFTGRRKDGDWRHLLERAGYACVLFDGASLFFLADEQAHRRDLLAAPASAVDDFVPASLWSAQQRLAELEHCIEQLSGEIVERDALASDTAALHDAEVERLSREIAEARLQARLSLVAPERLLDLIRAEAAREAERHREELAQLQSHLAQLPHYRAQAERLHRMVDLTASGARFVDRGGELMALRASLLRHAEAWREEVASLRSQLDEAVARVHVLQRSASWRVTSPLRSIGHATHVARRQPRRLPGLLRQRARALMGRPASSPGAAIEEASMPLSAADAETLTIVAGRLDGEMSLIADIIDSLSNVPHDDTAQTASFGPFYPVARLDEQLTRWIRGEVVRQRRSAF